MAMDGDTERIKSFIGEDAIPKDKVKDVLENYNKYYIAEKGGNVEIRKKESISMVKDFYNLVTHFYEFGWGQSFHFAPRHKWESFAASIARQEMLLALKCRLGKGMTCLDVGCGVGGPARTIARFSGAKIVGLNNNTYQLERCRVLTQQQGLKNLEWLEGDFHNIPAKDNTFDAAYACEAIEHAPEKVKVYREIFRVLKPGAIFATYEWIITDKFDFNNKKHCEVKLAIEHGNSVPDLERAGDILKAVKEAGFEILEHEDLALASDPETPWYHCLTGSFTIEGFRHTRLGHWVTHFLVSTLECLRLAPKGTTATSQLLMKTAVALVEGGKLGIFSPIYLIVARKPEERKTQTE
jgi:sterol 24-C-methyltransferase